MKSPQRPAAVPVIPLLALMLLLGACAPSDPLEQHVDATSLISYEMWRSKADESLSREQRSDLDKALQEIRFSIMAEGAASGREAIEAELYSRVDGLSIRSVLQLGFTAELIRAVAERDLTLAYLKSNEGVRTAPGDVASQDYLAHFREVQMKRLKASKDEIFWVLSRMHAAAIPAALVPSERQPVAPAG